MRRRNVAPSFPLPTRHLFLTRDRIRKWLLRCSQTLEDTAKSSAPTVMPGGDNKGSVAIYLEPSPQQSDVFVLHVARANRTNQEKDKDVTIGRSSSISLGSRSLGASVPAGDQLPDYFAKEVLRVTMRSASELEGILSEVSRSVCPVQRTGRDNRGKKIFTSRRRIQQNAWASGLEQPLSWTANWASSCPRLEPRSMRLASARFFCEVVFQEGSRSDSLPKLDAVSSDSRGSLADVVC